MNEQLERVKTKLKELTRLDSGFSLFGSARHHYRLNPTLPPQKIQQFEQTHSVKLPSAYVQFLTALGNGGAGPFYGLEPFENVLFDVLDYKRPNSLLNPSKPFLHIELWNLEFKPTVNEDNDEEEFEKQRLEFEEVYYDKEQNQRYDCHLQLRLRRRLKLGCKWGGIWQHLDGR